MTPQLTATSSIIIKASPAKVWHALTDPETIKTYLFGTTTVTDWKVGSPIYFRGEWEGKSYEDKGVILEIIPENILKYSYWSSMSGTEDKPENFQVVSYLVKPNSGQTELTIIQEGSKSEEAKNHSEQNWKTIMDSIKTIMES